MPHGEPWKHRLNPWELVKVHRVSPFRDARREERVAAVTPASGLQIVPLYDFSETNQQGLLLVKMLDGARIQLELWAGAASATDFDSGARIYLR